MTPKKEHFECMNVDRLNIKKFFFVLSTMSFVFLFLASLRTNNGVFISLVFSLIFAVPVGWALGMFIVVIYEGFKLIKPTFAGFIGWLFK